MMGYEEEEFPAFDYYMPSLKDLDVALLSGAEEEDPAAHPRGILPNTLDIPTAPEALFASSKILFEIGTKYTEDKVRVLPLL